ncbi:MAG: bacteriophage abortive infection AbiH family protein [Endomicrobium sp.]|jgi:hypothetical protein|nr:bacteriophage abortive infection AbiH family protein [Endomicrobium sp.]
MAKILYIIGNGFDLHHELKTKYSDFREYLQRHNSNLLYLLDTSFSADLWSDFEKNLAELNIREVFADNYDLLPDENSDRDGEKYSFIDKMEQIKEDLTVGLRNAMRDWILDLQDSKNIDDFLLNLDENAIFLTFNYSDTLERLYQINSNQITYIHNKAERLEINNVRPKERHLITDNSNIIIGHAVKNLIFEMPKTNQKGYNSYSYEEGYEAIKSYDNYKNTEQIIKENAPFFNSLNNIEKIVIIGHSLSDIDMPYFEEISKNTINSNEYRITYYGDIKLDITKLQSQKFLNKNKNKNVIYINFEDDIENIVNAFR